MSGLIIMIVVGLDISSSSTGWSVLKHGRFYKREGVDYGWIRTSSKDALSCRLAEFRKELKSLLERVQPDVVGIEDVFLSRNPKTMKLLSRFSGVGIETVRTILDIEPRVITVRTIRSLLGTQDKKSAFESIKARYKLCDWSFNKYNDITDSLAVSLYIHKNRESC